MSKTNYTKVEASFDEGLRKIMVGKLLNEADANQGNQTVSAIKPEDKSTLIALYHELKYFQKIGQEPYKKLGIPRKKIIEWMEHPENITASDWTLIKKCKANVDKAKKASLEKALEAGEDKLVDTARKKSVYKRFNINDKWLPLQ